MKHIKPIVEITFVDDEVARNHIAKGLAAAHEFSIGSAEERLAAGQGIARIVLDTLSRHHILLMGPIEQPRREEQA